MAGGTALARPRALGSRKARGLTLRAAAAVATRRASEGGAPAGRERDRRLDLLGRYGGDRDGQARRFNGEPRGFEGGGDAVDQHGRERATAQEAQQLLEKEQEAVDAGQRSGCGGRSFPVGPPGDGRGGGGGQGLFVSVAH